MPYDQFARALLTSSGSNFRVPPVNFYRAVQGHEPAAIAEAVALTFMGTRLNRWPEEQRGGLAAFFSRLAYKKTFSKWWANRVSVPVAIHLDHGDTFDRCMKAMKLGFSSLMLDCSSESIEDNAKHTNEVIKAAHAIGIPVEAEVGELARNDGSGNLVEAKNIANVEDIKKFVSLCQPDSLAIGIGNMHGFYKGEPVIRLDVLKQAAAITDIPLVLHGCTGMKDEVVKEAIQLGVAKINFGTLVRHKYVDFYKEAIDTLPHDGHSWKISQFAEKKLRGFIKEIIDLSGSAGKA
jgi:ketose-bisphosphate aldolase